MPLTIQPDAEAEAELDPPLPTVIVALKPKYMAYLEARAARAGETPGDHLGRILREFHAYHDRDRPDQRMPEPDRGTGPVVRRA
jgi:hypothetical protein